MLCKTAAAAIAAAAAAATADADGFLKGAGIPRARKLNAALAWCMGHHSPTACPATTHLGAPVHIAGSQTESQVARLFEGQSQEAQRKQQSQTCIMATLKSSRVQGVQCQLGAVS